MDSRRLSDLSRAAGALFLLTGLTVFAGCAPISGNDQSTRTPGTVIDDVAISNLAMRQLRRDEGSLANANINVLSHNGHVLLTGQVDNEAARARAQDIVAGLAQVQVVHNELAIGPATSLTTRSRDAWISSKVKTRLLSERGVPGDRIKVTTEDGAVYLVGIVPRAEADRAVAVTGTVQGVRKIVKVFQYLD
jgi:osmotically-inducible protein OsmY